MTVRLLRSWNGFAANTVVTLDQATEAALVRDFTASTNISGGFPYVQNAPYSQSADATGGALSGANNSNDVTAVIQSAINSGQPVTISEPGDWVAADSIWRNPLAARVKTAPGVVVRNAARTLRLGTGLDDPASWIKSPVPITRSTIAASVSGEPAGQYSTIYWPWVIRTDNLPNPLGQYYMYYSTDHGISGGAATGGIGMMFGPTPLGPWTNYGQVFVDTASQSPGNGETETPSVVWDPYSNNYRMFYHQNGAQWSGGNAIGQQSTLSATSTDGITWTKDANFILDVPNLLWQHGDGHLGYFLPFQGRSGLFAYSLYGGTVGADFALWACDGPLNSWQTEGGTLGYSSHLLPTSILGEAGHTGWNSSFVVQSGGQEWWVGRLSNFAAGATAANCRIAVAPISLDYKKLLARPVVIWRPTLPWESNDLRMCNPYIEGGVLYVYYSIAKNYVGVISHAL